MKDECTANWLNSMESQIENDIQDYFTNYLDQDKIKLTHFYLKINEMFITKLKE